MEEKLNLRQKLINIRKSIDFLQKTEKGERGKYVDAAMLLHKIREGMNTHGVLLSPSITKANTGLVDAPTKNSPSNKDFLVDLFMSYTWHDSESEEMIIVPWFATGTHMKDPSMAFGGALTYSERYFMMKYFQIPTSEDDPERFEQKTTEYITQAQVQDLQNIVNGKGYPVDATLQAFAYKRMNVQNIWALPADKFEEAETLIKALDTNPKKEEKSE